MNCMWTTIFRSPRVYWVGVHEREDAALPLIRSGYQKSDPGVFSAHTRIDAFVGGTGLEDAGLRWGAIPDFLCKVEKLGKTQFPVARRMRRKQGSAYPS